MTLQYQLGAMYNDFIKKYGKAPNRIIVSYKVHNDYLNDLSPMVAYSTTYKGYSATLFKGATLVGMKHVKNDTVYMLYE